MLSPEQCRSARAWLGWSQDDLARRAKIGVSTLKDFETGKRAPMRNNLDAIRAALESVGVAFIFRETGHPIGITVGALGDEPKPSGLSNIGMAVS